MYRDFSRIYIQCLSWILAGAVGSYALLEIAWNSTDMVSKLPTLLLLSLAGAGAGYLTVGNGRNGIRLGLVFVLAGIVLLPSPGGVLIAAATFAGGFGRSVAGPVSRGLASMAGTAVAVALATRVDKLIAWSEPHADLSTFLRFLCGFALVQSLALALGILLDERARGAMLDSPLRFWRCFALDLTGVPLAWILTSLIRSEATGPAIAFSLAVLAATVLARGACRARSELRRKDTELTNRIAELQTLHAISREILSSIEYDQVFNILDRECRKIFDVDYCVIALVEEGTAMPLSAYSRYRGERPDSSARSLRHGLAARVVTEKRPRKIDELLPPANSRVPMDDIADPRCRSAMAVPLIVEDRVIGVLSVQSERPEAYDYHQLSVLTTIGQQAAVAIENARHYRLATVDSLTGFFLRDYFFSRLTDEDRRVRRYGGKFALLMVDLDGFKDINDTNGHLAGDQYLKDIAAIIRSQLRGADAACRYGGDEFCLLLPETDLEGAQSIAERIRQAVAAHIVGVDGLALRTTVSIGVAVFPDHDSGDLRSLMRNADEALYSAKRSGRDRVVPFAA